MTKNEKIAQWFKAEGRGVSSMSMAYIATGATMGRFDAPYDPDDFGRCYELLKAVPEIRDDFPKIAQLVPQFSGILKHWDELCTIFERDGKAGKSEELYQRIQKLRSESEVIHAQQTGSEVAD